MRSTSNPWATEGVSIGDSARSMPGIPVLEIEVPPICDSMESVLRTCIDALIETVTQGRAR
jgi:hypothetical protein